MTCVRPVSGGGSSLPSMPLPRYLLPDSASVRDGRLFVAGCDTLDLADEFGTPLFVYDEEHVRARCREAVAAFGDGAAYATKAFLCTAMARLAHEEGLHLDVATGGELFVALHAGVPADRLVLHGNNKSDGELTMALEAGVGRVVVDSFDEMDRLDALAGGFDIPRVLIRITPGVEAHTHQFVATGHDDTKFGFTVSTGAADRAIRRALESPSMELVGIHTHIGSQVFRLASFEEAARIVAGLAAPFGLPELSLGGGLGVPYIAGETAPTITQWAKAVIAACRGAGVTGRILAEPGRAIVAAGAVTLYRVGTVKEIPGVRTYVAVDGGMSDNPRPVLYGSGYETFLPRATDAPRPRRVTVVGKHCESGDVLVREGWVPDDLVMGDLLATPVTGAYGHSMGSNYNKVPRPAVVFCRGGDAQLVVRREQYEDLTRLEVG
jgi:diaminopimelate decarboxylase